MSENDDEMLQQYSRYTDETVVPRCSEYTSVGSLFCQAELLVLLGSRKKKKKRNVVQEDINANC